MRRAPVTAYVGLGANLGDPVAAVRTAVAGLARLPGTRLRATSRLYRSAPVDAQGPDFVNAVVVLDTELTAPDLLHGLLALEHAAGRERPWRNAPRTLDLDLLLYGDACIDSPELKVPHARLNGRAFVLRPLAEVAPDRVGVEALRAVHLQDCEPISSLLWWHSDRPPSHAEGR